MKIYLMDQISWGELLAGVQNSSPYTAFTAEFLLIFLSSTDFLMFLQITARLHPLHRHNITENILVSSMLNYHFYLKIKKKRNLCTNKRWIIAIRALTCKIFKNPSQHTLESRIIIWLRLKNKQLRTYHNNIFY